MYGYLNENFQREYNNIFHMFSCAKKRRRGPNPRPLRLFSNEPLQPRQPCIEPLVKVFQSVIFLEQKTSFADADDTAEADADTADVLSMTSSVSCDTCRHCDVCQRGDSVDSLPALSRTAWKCDKVVQCDQFSIFLASNLDPRIGIFEALKRTTEIRNSRKNFLSKSLPSIL